MRTYTCGIRGVLVGMLLAASVLGGCKDRTTPSNRVVLKESDLPAQQLHLLNKEDVLQYVLPSGRRLRWRAKTDGFSAAQTTACGLKAYLQENGVNVRGA